MDTIKYTGQIKGFPLIKINSHEIIAKIQNGSFRMNSLKIYREMYDNCNDNIVGDPYEGKFIIHDAVFQIEELGVNEHVKDFAFSTANENDFVFCMFGINPEKHISFKFTDEQKQKLIGFNDTALLITDIGEFATRIEQAATGKGLKIKSDFVNYYDETIDDVARLLSLVRNGMENIVFNKVKDYAYQQEYRFTIPNFTGDEYLELNIGDITDISKVFTTEELFNSYIEKHSN